MLQSTTKKLTFEQYLVYNDGTDNRYEFEDGNLLLMPPATGKHEAIITMLLIRFFLEIQRLGLPLQVRPSGTEVLTTGQGRKPDVCVITNDQAREIENSTAILKTPPLLAVEVVSPESIDRDYNRKFTEYQNIGIPEYWIVDPIKNQVTVCLLANESYQVKQFTGSQRIVSSTFSELALTVEQVLLA